MRTTAAARGTHDGVVHSQHFSCYDSAHIVNMKRARNLPPERAALARARQCETQAFWEMILFYDSLNFDAPHRANARAHAQAETANRLLSLCSTGGSKENHQKV